MKTKTSELTGAALDWAVAKCEGVNEEAFRLYYEPTEPADYDSHGYPEFRYSTVWAQGGPIIERKDISTIFVSGDLGEPKSYWVATANQQAWQYGYGPYHEQDEERSLQIYKSECLFFGPTPLIAAMRCYTASKLGDEIEVPDELLIGS